MNRRSLLATMAALTLSVAAQAAELRAGFTTVERAGMPVALFYPTQAAEEPQVLGVSTLSVARGGTPEGQVRGLVLMSHGTGGSELGHARLAQALARRGYLVAAPRHTGDNWRDTSLRALPEAGYFSARPQQASAVLDALLADPAWGPRIARDAQGPKVAAVGHSAGGYTVLALAGAQPAPARMARHCQQDGAADPIFCSLSGRLTPETPAPTADLRDPRVRAVAAMAPVGAVIKPDSLARVSVPVLLAWPEGDRFLVPRFHAAALAPRLPPALTQTLAVPNAWHFAFLDTPTQPIPSPDGDLRADPPGFDRAAFLDGFAVRLADFLDGALR